MAPTTMSLVQTDLVEETPHNGLFIGSLQYPAEPEPEKVTVKAKRTRMNRKRPHQKVRTGCQRCKAKRIKCDEQRPQCSHCKRYEQVCTYPSLQELGAISHSDTQYSDVSAGADTTPTSEPSQSAYQSSELSITIVEPQIIDLELMHHWTMHAYLGFGDRPEDAQRWRDDVALMAFRPPSDPTLLHSILSVSALHLAKTRPAQQRHYLDIGTQHHSQAIGPHRAMIEDPCTTITEDNASAVLACSNLTVTFVFARTQIEMLGSRRRPSSRWQGLPSWIMLQGGRRGALEQVASWIVKGPLAYQLKSLGTGQYCPPSPHDSRLTALDSMLTNATAMGSEASDSDLAVYRESLKILRQSFDRAFATIIDVTAKTAFFGWIEQLPLPYFGLAEAGRPEALILLLHAYVLVKEASQTCWFMEGAAENMLTAVDAALDPRFRGYIAWPQQVISHSQTQR